MLSSGCMSHGAVSSPPFMRGIKKCVLVLELSICLGNSQPPKTVLHTHSESVKNEETAEQTWKQNPEARVTFGQDEEIPRGSSLNESVFHVNRRNKYPSHEDDRIAYQVFIFLF